MDMGLKFSIMPKFSFQKVDVPRLDVYFQNHQNPLVNLTVIEDIYSKLLTHQVSTLNLQSPYAWRIRKFLNGGQGFQDASIKKYMSSIRRLLNLSNFISTLATNISDARYAAVIDYYDLTGKLERYNQLCTSLLAMYRLPRGLANMMSDIMSVVTFQVPRDNKQVCIIPMQADVTLSNIGAMLSELTTMDETSTILSSLFDASTQTRTVSGWLYAYEFYSTGLNTPHTFVDDTAIESLTESMMVISPKYTQSQKTSLLTGLDENAKSLFKRIESRLTEGFEISFDSLKSLITSQGSNSELFGQLVTIPNILVDRLENGRFLGLDVSWSALRKISVANGVVNPMLDTDLGESISDLVVSDVPAWMASDFDSIYIHDKQYIIDNLLTELLTEQNLVHGSRSK